MTKEKYTQKIKSLVLQKCLIDQKLEDIQPKMAEELKAGNLTAHYSLYHDLIEERYEVHNKLSKVEDQMKKDGFQLQTYCDIYNEYFEFYNTIK